VTTQGKAKSVGSSARSSSRSAGPGRAAARRRRRRGRHGGSEEHRAPSRNPGGARVQQQSGSDLRAAAREIRVAGRNPHAGAAGVEITVARDYARSSRSQISGAGHAAGGALVVAVVLCFLRNYRSTLIAGVAIPTSVIASFTLLYALDLSLNSMTLMALSLAVGLVIDDAIVVLESVFRKVEQGQDSMSAGALRLAGGRHGGGLDDAGRAASSFRSASCRAPWAATSTSSASPYRRRVRRRGAHAHADAREPLLKQTPKEGPLPLPRARPGRARARPRGCCTARCATAS
jgi:hypothetical protein